MARRYSVRVVAHDKEKGEDIAIYEYPNLDRAGLLEVEETLMDTFGMGMLEKGIAIAEQKGDVPPEKLAAIKSRLTQKKRGLAMIHGGTS